MLHNILATDIAPWRRHALGWPAAKATGLRARPDEEGRVLTQDAAFLNQVALESPLSGAAQLPSCQSSRLLVWPRQKPRAQRLRIGREGYRACSGPDVSARGATQSRLSASLPRLCFGSIASACRKSAMASSRRPWVSKRWPRFL